MRSYSAVEDLEVIFQNEIVARLQRTPKGCRFEYTHAYLDSSGPSLAVHLPKSPEALELEGLANLPTYFAGLLPEGVMYQAIRNIVGAASDDLFAMLAATGSDAIGDISVRIPGDANGGKLLELESAILELEAILGGTASETGRYTALPGVQPKISIGAIARFTRGPEWIVKLPNPAYPGILENEHACMTLAKRCGLLVAETRLMGDKLLVRRFDRVKPNQSTGTRMKVHVEDGLQLLDQYPNSKYTSDFQALVDQFRKIGLPPAAVVRIVQLFLFSYLIGNGDLHEKNVSLVLDRGEMLWQPSPAYDLLSTLPYGNQLPGADRMAIPLMDESVGRFTQSDFLEFGEMFGVAPKPLEQMINRLLASFKKQCATTLEGTLDEECIRIMLNRAATLGK